MVKYLNSNQGASSAPRISPGAIGEFDPGNLAQHQNRDPDLELKNFCEEHASEIEI